MFTDPQTKMLMPLIGWKLLCKKMGFRTLMDVIALDPQLIAGSHGVVPASQEDWPVLIGDQKVGATLESTDVYQMIWKSLTR